MIKISIVIRWFLILLLFFSFCFADADYLFVSPYGNDVIHENNGKDKGGKSKKHNTECSFNNPCKTIKYTISQAKDGDDIQVGTGIYNENTIIIDKSISISGPNAFVDPKFSAGFRTAGSSNEAIIDGSFSSDNVFKIITDNVSINGLEIRKSLADAISYNFNKTRSNIKIEYNIIHDINKGIRLDSVNNSLINNNLIFDVSGYAVRLKQINESNSVITNNEVYNASALDPVLILSGNKGFIKLENNIIHDSKASAGISIIDTVSSDTGTEISLLGNTIENCTFSKSIGNIFYHGDAISIGSYTGYVAGANNSIYIVKNNIKNNLGNSGHGIFISRNDDIDTISSITISGNTIFANSGFGISINAGGGKPGIISNNIIKGNKEGGIYLGAENPITKETNNIDLTIYMNDISFNEKYGINNNISSYMYIVNASKNWWGFDSGPYNATDNIKGLSNMISNNVVFKPYYIDESMTEFTTIAEEAEELSSSGDLSLSGSDSLSGNLIDGSGLLNIIQDNEQIDLFSASLLKKDSGIVRSGSGEISTGSSMTGDVLDAGLSNSGSLDMESGSIIDTSITSDILPTDTSLNESMFSMMTTHGNNGKGKGKGKGKGNEENISFGDSLFSTMNFSSTGLFIGGSPILINSPGILNFSGTQASGTSRYITLDTLTQSGVYFTLEDLRGANSGYYAIMSSNIFNLSGGSLTMSASSLFLTLSGNNSGITVLDGKYSSGSDTKPPEVVIPPGITDSPMNNSITVLTRTGVTTPAPGKIGKYGIQPKFSLQVPKYQEPGYYTTTIDFTFIEY